MEWVKYVKKKSRNRRNYFLSQFFKTYIAEFMARRGMSFSPMWKDCPTFPLRPRGGITQTAWLTHTHVRALTRQGLPTEFVGIEVSAVLARVLLHLLPAAPECNCIVHINNFFSFRLFNMYLPIIHNLTSKLITRLLKHADWGKYRKLKLVLFNQIGLCNRDNLKNQITILFFIKIDGSKWRDAHFCYSLMCSGT